MKSYWYPAVRLYILSVAKLNTKFIYKNTLKSQFQMIKNTIAESYIMNATTRPLNDMWPSSATKINICADSVFFYQLTKIYKCHSALESISHLCIHFNLSCNSFRNKLNYSSEWERENIVMMKQLLFYCVPIKINILMREKQTTSTYIKITIVCGWVNEKFLLIGNVISLI